MKKQITSIFLASVFALFSLTATAGAESVKWKMANPWPEKHPATKAMIKMFDTVRSKTNGTVDIQMMYLRSVGYKQGDLLRVLKQDVAQMSLFVPYYVSRDAPLLANVLPTGGLKNAEENLKIAPVQRAYAKKILGRDWDAVMAAPFFNRGGRDLIIVASEKINTLDGLKGKKVRHFDKLGLKALAKLDISAQILPQSELYLSLKTGVIDAAVHGMTNARRQSIYEVAKYFSEFTPFPGQGAPYGFVVLKKNWAKLSADQKKVFTEAGKVSWDEGVKLWRNATLTNEARDFMVSKGGVNLPPFSQADRDKLQATVFKVWKEACEKQGPESVKLYNDVVAALKN